MNRLNFATKPSKYFFLIFYLALSTTCISVQAQSLFGSSDSSFCYHVVIGAFNYKSNAEKCASKAKMDSMTAEVEWISSRRLYYVIGSSFTKHEHAIAMLSRLRGKKTYFDAWIYAPFKPRAIDTLLVNKREDPSISRITFFVHSAEDSLPITNANLVISGSIVPLNIDFDSLNNHLSFKGKQTIFCNVLGYRSASYNFDFSTYDGLPYRIDTTGHRLIISLPILPVQKGDVTVAHILFFSNAAIVRPESKPELDQLVLLMLNRPALRIKIHGHTNGNDGGKLIMMGQSENFFKVTKDSKIIRNATAIRLSEERAKIVSHYLAKQGINPSRIEVQGWGGTKPLFQSLTTEINGQNSDVGNEPDEKKNLRVEIEIL